jgi:hypothetical protein
MSEDYSEAQRDVVLKTGEAWFKAFARSPAFARLSESHQRKAGAVTQFFASYTYDYLGLSPDRWNRSAVAECCTEILARKVSAEPPFFEAIAPVLSAFFSFLEEHSLLPNGRALAQVAESSHAEIVANARDKSLWGPAKRLVMAAMAAGVDIEQPGALEAYAAQFNVRQMARAGFGPGAGAFAPFAHSPWLERRPARPSTGRYDPCPCGSGKKFKFCCEKVSR